jgi:hypothetical protein
MKLLKLSITILICVLFSQITDFAQTKFDEYDFISTDEETARLDNLAIHLINNPETKGVFIVYSGNCKSRIGSFMPYIVGVKRHFNFYKNLDLNRITFAIARGKNVFDREIWIVKDDEKLPDFERENFELNNIQSKLLYVSTCLDCEPAIASLSTDLLDWKLLGTTLKENPNYELLVFIEGNTAFDDKGNTISPKKYYENFRNSLSEEFGLDKKRFKLNYIKKSKQIGTGARFYIVPKTDKK